MKDLDIPCFMYDVMKTRKIDGYICTLIDLSFAVVYYDICFIFVIVERSELHNSKTFASDVLLVIFKTDTSSVSVNFKDSV
jgi:hypothetical protein